MSRNLYPYDIFVLQYDNGVFYCALVTQERFVSLSVAKVYALSSFGFCNEDVPVIYDSSGNFWYYHSRHRTWYKNLSKQTLQTLFHWLVPSTLKSVSE